MQGWRDRRTVLDVAERRARALRDHKLGLLLDLLNNKLLDGLPGPLAGGDLRTREGELYTRWCECWPWNLAGKLTRVFYRRLVKNAHRRRGVLGSRGLGSRGLHSHVGGLVAHCATTSINRGCLLLNFEKDCRRWHGPSFESWSRWSHKIKLILNCSYGRYTFLKIVEIWKEMS